MVPANPVDRTVQQAGKDRNREKTKNIGKNIKTYIYICICIYIYIFRDSCLDPPPPKSLDFVCLMRVFCFFVVFCVFVFSNVFFGFWGFVLLQRVWKQFVGPPVKEYASNF